MRAHLVQFDIAWEDKRANYRRVEDLLAGAGVRRGDLVLLPEMFDTGFSFRIDATADDDGATLAFLHGLAQRTGAVVQGGRTVRARPLAENRAPVVGPGGLIVEYTKIHPFTFGREPEFFQPGGEVRTYRWGKPPDALSVCPAICYDLRFPELFRKGLSMGAEVFALGANWPDARHEHWRALAVARAIENQAYVLAVNRCGADPHLTYLGGTLAVDPHGVVIEELGRQEGVLSAEVEPEVVRAWRAAFPAWKDAGRVH